MLWIMWCKHHKVTTRQTVEDIIRVQWVFWLKRKRNWYFFTSFSSIFTAVQSKLVFSVTSRGRQDEEDGEEQFIFKGKLKAAHILRGLMMINRRNLSGKQNISTCSLFSQHDSVWIRAIKRTSLTCRASQAHISKIKMKLWVCPVVHSSTTRWPRCTSSSTGEPLHHSVRGCVFPVLHPQVFLSVFINTWQFVSLLIICDTRLLMMSLFCSWLQTVHLSGGSQSLSLSLRFHDDDLRVYWI